jgi:hypothetical protein
MGLNIRLYNIISDGTYSVRYKSGVNPYPEYDNTTFTLYGTGLTVSSIELTNLNFDTQYWVKMTNESTNRYIIKNINTHNSEGFPCYDPICFDININPTPTPNSTSVPPTSTPTPNSTSVPPTSTPTPNSTSVPPTSTPTPNSTSVPPTSTPTSTETPTPTSTPTPNSTSVPPTSTPTSTETPTPTSTSTPTSTETPTPTFSPPNCTCWSFENTGIGVANVSYDECNSGPTQTNVDIGATIYKCVTYGQTPSTNSGDVLILSSLTSCDNQGDCEPTLGTTPTPTYST